MVQLVGPAVVRVGLSLPVDSIIEQLEGLPESIRFIEIEHRSYAASGANLIQIASRITEFRRLVEWLGIRGWFVYKTDGAISSLVSSGQIPSLWHKVVEGSYSTDSLGTVYSVNDDNVVDDAKSLIVIFSSMALLHDGSGLNRYFEQNFSSISRHVGSGVVILRIADIDGVVGGFYSPTRFVPDRVERVQSLIREISRRYRLDSERVVLYGGSKGGTGALLHALRSSDRWKCVAVDPVVDDSYYEARYGDSHWTGGEIFVQRKVDLFRQAVDDFLPGSESARLAVVTSPRSPLYSSIDNLTRRLPSESLLLAVSHDSRITDHPHVSARTLRFVTGLLNVWSAGLALSGCRIDID